MNTMTIGKKISLGTAALLLLIVIAGAVSIARIKQVNKEVKNITSESLPKLSSLSTIVETANRSTYYAVSSLSAGSLPGKIQDEEIVAAELAGFDAAVETYQDHDTSARGRELMAEIVSAQARIYRGWVRVMPLSHAMKNQEAQSMWASGIGRAVEDRAEGIDRLIAYTSADATASGTQAASTGENGLVWAISILCFSLIFGGRLAAFVVRAGNNALTLAVAEVSEGFSDVQSVEIDSSSGRLSRTSQVIDDIAFQTNILALSTALEAACARESALIVPIVPGKVEAASEPRS